MPYLWEQSGQNTNQRFSPGCPPGRNPKSLPSVLLENSIQDSQKKLDSVLGPEMFAGRGFPLERCFGKEHFMSKQGECWPESCWAWEEIRGFRRLGPDWGALWKLCLGVSSLLWSTDVYSLRKCTSGFGRMEQERWHLRFCWHIHSTCVHGTFL